MTKKALEERAFAVETKILLFIFLASLSFAPRLFSQQVNTEKETFDRFYKEAKLLFYDILKESFPSLKLPPKERKMILRAGKKMPGLYEHLMNFYYFHEKFEQENDNNSTEHLLEFSRRMAEEFIQSLEETIPTKEISPLKSILLSCGYYSRKMRPILRKHFRPMENRVKGQWAFDELKVRRAHSLSKGKGIKLAIVDSGVDSTINEIRMRILKYMDFIDASTPGGDKEKFPYDWQGHGTSIASVIVQVAPEVELLIVKISDNETMKTVPPSRWSGYLAAAGMLWAAQNGADIINLSVALTTDSEALREASEFCWERNVVIISAMANAPSKDYETIPYFPAVYPWTIAVGGIEKEGRELKICPYSSKGDYIDVVAPASRVIVEMPSYLDKRKRAQATYGNSIAVPFVSAESALLLSAMDSETLQKLKKTPGRLVETVRTILRKTASNEKLGFQTPNPVSGYGLVDIEKAVLMAKDLRIEK